MSAQVREIVGLLATIVSMITICVSCSGSAAPGGPAACRSADAVWAASDYSSSAVGSLALTGEVESTLGVDLGTDPVLAASHGHFFLVAREEGFVFELDPHCGTPISRFNVPKGDDPYDVAVASNGMRWIPFFLAPVVGIYGADGTLVRNIDISSYGASGNPFAAAIQIVQTPAGEKAFVALDRLDKDERSTQPSFMLRIDVATFTVEAQIVLVGRNPFAVYPDGDILWLAEPGNFDDASESDAGIERFDTSTSTTTLAVRETDLGGSVAQVAVSGSCGVAIVADATPNVNATSLVTFDPSRGAVLLAAAKSPLATPGFQLEALAWSAGAALVGDRRRAANGYPVHAFSADASCGLAVRRDAVFLPLPPVDVRALTSP